MILSFYDVIFQFFMTRIVDRIKNYLFNLIIISNRCRPRASPVFFFREMKFPKNIYRTNIFYENESFKNLSPQVNQCVGEETQTQVSQGRTPGSQLGNFETRATSNYQSKSCQVKKLSNTQSA